MHGSADERFPRRREARSVIVESVDSYKKNLAIASDRTKFAVSSDRQGRCLTWRLAFIEFILVIS